LTFGGNAADILGRSNSISTTEVNMSSRLLRIVIGGIFFAVIFLQVWATLDCKAETPVVRGTDLLTIGKPATNPIGLKVWAGVLPGKPTAGKELSAIGFRANRNAYVAVVAVSKAGDVALSLPGAAAPGSAIKKGERYTLAAAEVSSRMRLPKGKPEGKLAFYVSSQPVDLGPLQPSLQKPWITIPSNETGKMKILADKLKKASEGKGFNRVTFDMKRLAERPKKLRLMGYPKGESAAESASAPGSVESDLPGQVTGAQGRTQKIKPKE
jgi:hypothetical protein